MENLKFNYYVATSNNGNHTGKNRTWNIDHCTSKEVADELVAEKTSENSDIEFGLTICKVVTESEIDEMTTEENIINW